MFIVGILSWWYGAGWRLRVSMLRARLSETADFFSIDLLLRTFFSPFRQISAGKVQGSLGLQLRAFVDRLISRFIGAMIRFTMIIIGSVALVLYGLIGSIMLVVWALVPAAPIVGVVLCAIEWMPWNP